MSIITLSLTNVFAILSDMNHATMHGKRLRQYGIGKVGKASFVEGVDASLRKSQIDRLAEVQWGIWIPEIWLGSEWMLAGSEMICRYKTHLFSVRRLQPRTRARKHRERPDNLLVQPRQLSPFAS